MTPLSPAEFARLMEPFAPFEAAPLLAVAVSGGADSLALTLLAAQWAQSQGGQVVALTVDHGLRAAAAAEARQVGHWLAARGIAHRILTWGGVKPATGIQAAARHARHALLAEACRQGGALHLLLAHHRDDQAETLLQRLCRGSGAEGLAAMAPESATPWGRLLRPLLPVPKARLMATLRALDQPWIEDPSNRDAAHGRVRLRQLAPLLAAEGGDGARLAATAARLARTRQAVEQAVAQAAAAHVRLDPLGYAACPRSLFAALPEEVALRLLSRVLIVVSGAAYPPRLEGVERLWRGLLAAKRVDCTVSGCRVQDDGAQGAVLFAREAARLAPPVALVPATLVEWDGRFRAKVADDVRPGRWLGGLGGGWRRLGALSRPRPVPAIARAAIPVVTDGEGTLCAAPLLGYNQDSRCSGLDWIEPVRANPLTAAPRRLVWPRQGII